MSAMSVSILKKMNLKVHISQPILSSATVFHCKFGVFGQFFICVATATPGGFSPVAGRRPGRTRDFHGLFDYRTVSKSAATKCVLRPADGDLLPLNAPSFG